MQAQYNVKKWERVVGSAAGFLFEGHASVPKRRDAKAGLLLLK